MWYFTNKILKGIIIFFLSIFLVFNFTAFSYAQLSTVDKCLASVSCSGGSSGVIRNAIKSTPQTANNIVNFRKVQNGNSISTAQKIIEGAAVSIFGFGDNKFISTKITNSDLVDLRGKAVKRYCDVYVSVDERCYAEIALVQGSGNIESFEVTSSTRIEFDIDVYPWHQGFNYYPLPTDSRYPETLDGFLAIRSEGRIIYGKVFSPSHWDSFDQEEKVGLVDDYLSDTDIEAVLQTNKGEEDLDNIILSEVDTTIEFKGDNFTDGDRIVDVNTWTPAASAPDISDFSSTELSGTDTTTVGSDGETTTGETTEETDGESGSDEELIVPENITEIDPEAPDTNTIVEPQISPVEEVVFNAPNFLDYGVTVFSNKFPFDIVGDLDSNSYSNDCPVYVFFDREFELCPVRDFLVAFKIPVIIGFLWRVYHSL